MKLCGLCLFVFYAWYIRANEHLTKPVRNWMKREATDTYHMRCLNFGDFWDGNLKLSFKSNCRKRNNNNNNDDENKNHHTHSPNKNGNRGRGDGGGGAKTYICSTQILGTCNKIVMECPRCEFIKVVDRSIWIDSVWTKIGCGLLTDLGAVQGDWRGRFETLLLLVLPRVHNHCGGIGGKMEKAGSGGCRTIG